MNNENNKNNGFNAFNRFTMSNGNINPNSNQNINNNVNSNNVNSNVNSNIPLNTNLINNNNLNVSTVPSLEKNKSNININENVVSTSNNSIPVSNNVVNSNPILPNNINPNTIKNTLPNNNVSITNNGVNLTPSTNNSIPVSNNINPNTNANTLPNNNVSITNNGVNLTPSTNNSIPVSNNINPNTLSNNTETSNIGNTPSVNNISNDNISKEDTNKKESVLDEIEDKKYNLLTPKQKQALIEKRKKEQEEKDNYKYVPASTGKKVFSTFIIILLFLIVLFLPEINNYIINMSGPSGNINTDDIPTGKLKCVLEKSDNKFNHDYTYYFNYTDNLLQSMSYKKNIKGDSVVDKDELENKYNKCLFLKSFTDKVAGVSVNCDLIDGTYSLHQDYDYEIIDKKQITTAFYEAGLLYPEFEYNSNISEVEKKMNASGFTCVKSR